MTEVLVLGRIMVVACIGFLIWAVGIIGSKLRKRLISKGHECSIEPYPKLDTIFVFCRVIGLAIIVGAWVVYLLP